MKKKELKLWHPIIGYGILQLFGVLNNHLYNTDTHFLLEDILSWALGICLFMFLYIIIRDIYRLIKRLFQKGKPAVNDREIEQKEIDIVRKSNDILLHLIQDKNREEDGH